jgi:uncharacterized membrane protein YwaF
MRTALFLAAGFLLLAALLILARLFSPHYPEANRWATIGFVVLWCAIAAANMAVGVAKAGYSVGEELPIFVLLFAVPAGVAVLLKWRWL